MQRGGDSRIEEENSPIHLQLLMLAPTQAISFDSDPFEIIKMSLERAIDLNQSLE